VWEPRGSLGLCPACRRSLVRWPAGCHRCGRHLDAAPLPEGHRCGDCRHRPPPFERLLAAWSYQPPLDAVLTGLKFRRLEYLGDHLGRHLADLFAAELAPCEVVVPVPLHWRRRLARGYNQAAAVARPLARALDLPYHPALRRRRATPPQSRLPRGARLANLRDAFTPRRAGPCRDRHVLLVDDVTTTGATLQEAAATLRRAGARTVTAVAAARTPTGDLARRLAVRSGG